jgi:hypothetical protein
MNSKDFIQTLRKVIREEVQVAVRTELKQFSSVISEVKQSAKPATTYTETIKPKVKQQPKQYTGNPTLNELLNGTSGFKGDGPMAYLEEQLDYNDFSEWPKAVSRFWNRSHSELDRTPSDMMESQAFNRMQSLSLPKTTEGSSAKNVSIGVVST